jgi:hypothetical protein
MVGHRELIDRCIKQLDQAETPEECIKVLRVLASTAILMAQNLELNAMDKENMDA